MTIKRRKRNEITKILTENNTEETTRKRMGSALISYFIELFKPSNPSNTEADNIMEGITSKISEEEHAKLQKSITKNEV